VPGAWPVPRVDCCALFIAAADVRNETGRTFVAFPGTYSGPVIPNRSSFTIMHQRSQPPLLPC
jgi:hypothetical protein